MNEFTVRAPAIRIDQKFAKAILGGKKAWEFRKKPLELYKDYLLVEKGEECGAKVVGSVMFTQILAAARIILEVEIPRMDGRPIDASTSKFLKSYAAEHEILYGHLVSFVSIFDLPVRGRYSNGRISFQMPDATSADRVSEAIRHNVIEKRMHRFDMQEVSK